MNFGVEANGSNLYILEDYSNISVKFNNTPENVARIAVEDYNEILTFKLCLKASYFNGEDEYLAEDALIPVGEATLKVYVYNAAEGIIVNGDDIEISSKDEKIYRGIQRRF